MYRYFNPNPDHNSANDCVIRAFCKIFNDSWDQIYDILWSAGKKAREIPTTNWVWESLLESDGYQRIYLRCATNCPTLAEFAARHRTGKYIVCSGTHVVALVDGDWYDTWDSGDVKVQYYFSKERL